MSWTVYILECGDTTLYTGIAKDVAKRLAEHETGKGAKYTKGRGPFKLIFQEQHASRGAALKRESAIKSLDRSAKRRLAGYE
jgi:putative endonuclease